MTDHPILFNSEMVRAILDGRKTQTRRIASQPEDLKEKNFGFPVGQYKKAVNVKDNAWAFQTDRWKPNKNSAHRQVTSKPFKCPYGVPGDLLWVREPFRISQVNAVQRHAHGIYTRDGSEFHCDVPVQDITKHMKWKKPYSGKSSLFMFKSLVRLWLKVKSVRVERVQEISLADIEAEGVTFDLIRSLLKPTKTKQGHWISGRECDSSEDYCYDCAKKKVDELNAKDGDKDNIVDGGWENHDSDYPARCETCDCLLNYWPTNHLFETELDGFESCGDITPLSNEDRYSFDTLCCAAPDQGVAIQNRVLKLCWRYLWDSINKDRGFGWNVNPFVWVVGFERSNSNG